jgi:hypothetical protein
MQESYLLLSETEGQIAVILMSENEEKDNLYVKIREAISDHFVCEDKNNVALQDSDEWNDFNEGAIVSFFEANTIEDGENCIRDFSLLKIPVYE